MIKKDNVNKETNKQTYAYYSRVLNKPFDSLLELTQAEDAYYAKLKAKEDQTAQKKADAQKVEDAFKALNTARKTYKDKLLAITEQYSKDLKDLMTAFENDKKEVQSYLAAAEKTYSEALKAFTDKYPEGYHLTLKDGDFETTISSSTTTAEKPYTFSDLFDMIFSF